MKFRCNLCSPTSGVKPYTCNADKFDDGMRAMQQHMNVFHTDPVDSNTMTVVIEDITINATIKARLP